MATSQTETFVSPTATIYKSGAGQPFPPGTPVKLPADHAADFRKAGLDKAPAKATPAPAQPESQGADKPTTKKA